ncbi:MAG: glutamate--tRNA ligase [Syntrophobacterales bacterium]|jgi:glutamyl-tRNA synthetase|nr:glutamate--tRNA ligase [Syntrophobacterales bacterium]
MQNSPVRVRFAPSPTGELHIGNARTALYNWLFARHHGGRFILRIEDTDQERSTAAFRRNLIDDLRWLNIDWDEGPEKEGDYGPYLQSERLNIYHSYLQNLMDEGLVYPCYCTEEELAEERKRLLAMKKMPRYLGKCRAMTKDEREERERQGEKPAYRFKVGREKIEFNDMIRGPMQFDGEAIGDFIVMRSSGLPAYNLAVVIDDHLMKITHIIRGEDHLSNTASQLMLYNALGFPHPRFCHHSLILGTDRAKLSKRHGSVSVGEFRKRGFLPEAMVNYFAILGSSLPGGEIHSLQETISLFRIENLGRGGAVFDEGKLKWVNTTYLRGDTPASFRRRMTPLLSPYLLGGLPPERIDAFLDLIRPNMDNIHDLERYMSLLAEEPFQADHDAAQVLSQPQSREILTALYQLLSPLDSFTLSNLGQVFKTLAAMTNMKGKELYMPIRAAITGITYGSEMDKLLLFMDRDLILKRLGKLVASYTANNDT